MKNMTIYLYPFAIDIVISLALFVSRHSFAEKGMSVSLVGRISVIYGIVYILASSFMGRVVRSAHAKLQMIIASAATIVILCILANLQNVTAILSAFALIPLAASLFFNAFQAYMMDVDSGANKSLSKSVGHYTFAWSIGFALGPFVSAAAKKAISWSAAYYTAAVITLLVAICVVLFKPHRAPQDETPEEDPDVRPGDRALPYAGWMGVLVCFSSWICITTYWPVQSQALGFSTEAKGLVEFAVAMSQALGALFICQFTHWYHRPALLPLVALPGICGAAVFAFASTPAVFAVGGCGVGFCSGMCFTYMVYHAMFDKKHAVKRIARNELTVGFACVGGPTLAWLFASHNGDYQSSYLKLVIFVIVGVTLQLLLALYQSRPARMADQ